MNKTESRLSTRFLYLSLFTPLVLILISFVILVFTTSPVARVNSVGSFFFALIVALVCFLLLHSVWRRAKIELACLRRGIRHIIISRDDVIIPLHVFQKSYRYYAKRPHLLAYRFNHKQIEYLSWLIVGLGGEMTSEVTIVMVNGKEYHLNPNNIGNRKRFLAKMVEYGNVQIISHTPTAPPPAQHGS